MLLQMRHFGNTEASFTYVGSSTNVDNINSTKYTIKNGYVSKITAGETLAVLKRNVQASGNIVVKDRNGNVVNDSARLATGMRISVGSSLTYTLVVTGDVDGNGINSINDLAKSCLHYIGKQTLTGAYKEAADFNGNGDVNVNDLARLQLILIGKN